MVEPMQVHLYYMHTITVASGYCMCAFVVRALLSQGYFLFYLSLYVVPPFVRQESFHKAGKLCTKLSCRNRLYVVPLFPFRIYISLSVLHTLIFDFCIDASTDACKMSTGTGRAHTSTYALIYMYIYMYSYVHIIMQSHMHMIISALKAAILPINQ